MMPAYRLGRNYESGEMPQQLLELLGRFCFIFFSSKKNGIFIKK
jgi:hypothetical protein